MQDKAKQKRFLKFKIKSAAIRWGWFMAYPVLLFVVLGIFITPWLYAGTVVCLYPLWQMTVEIKPIRKELKDLTKEESSTYKENPPQEV